MLEQNNLNNLAYIAGNVMPNVNPAHIPTLMQAFETYLADRRDLRESTLITYREIIKKAEHLLDMPINEIKFSDIKHHYAYLRYDKGYKPAYIELLNSLIVPTLNLAVRDDILIKNPAIGAYHEVARGDAWKITHRKAVDAKTQEIFLTYIHNTTRFKRWENLFILLFGTGMRIGEAVGLKWEDISFKSKMIQVRRSISFRNKEYIEGPPKSAAGFRTIPMLPAVREALLRENQIAKLTKVPKDKNVPGKTGYIFLNSKGKIHCPVTINQAIENIVHAYNKEHLNNPIEVFSVHQIRHAFCQRLCEEDVNIKVIQSIMGHSDFETTMNVYAEVSEGKIVSEFEELEGKMIV